MNLSWPDALVICVAIVIGLPVVAMLIIGGIAVLLDR